MLGVEFVKDKKTKEPFERFNFSAEIVKYCFEKGLVLTGGVLGSADGISGDALQIAPPFIIEEEQMDWTISLIAEAIEMIMKQRAE